MCVNLSMNNSFLNKKAKFYNTMGNLNEVNFKIKNMPPQ